MNFVLYSASRALPEFVKRPLRPIYDWLTSKPADKESGLTIERISNFDIAYRRGTADRQVLDHAFGHDIFLKSIPEYQAKPDDIVLDIGAHIGTFSLLMSSVLVNGKVYAVEASHDTYNLLRINLALNRSDNVYAHHVAMLDKAGEVKLYHDKENWGHTAVKSLSSSSEAVRCTTLADFMDHCGIMRCSLIKMNCEGSEFPILLSTPPHVLKRCAYMLILCHGDLWPKNTIEELKQYLESCGFECSLKNQTLSRAWLVAVQKAA